MVNENEKKMNCEPRKKKRNPIKAIKDGENLNLTTMDHTTSRTRIFGVLRLHLRTTNRIKHGIKTPKV